MSTFNGGTLPTISMEVESQAPSDNHYGMWSGMPIDKALVHYRELYSLGTISSIHFGVMLEPFDANGKLAENTLELFDPYDLSHKIAGEYNAFELGQDGFLAGKLIGRIPLVSDMKLPWLCQSIDLSVLDAQSDSANVGSFQLNFLTGNSSGEISIPFIETRNAAILNSARAIKAIMFPHGQDGGTQALPKDYLMRMTIYIYDRHSYSTKVFEIQHLVALQAGSIPLDVANRNGVGIVTLNFIKMFPLLK